MKNNGPHQKEQRGKMKKPDEAGKTFFLTNMVNLVNIVAMEKQNRKSILDMIYASHLYLQKLESTPRDYGTGDLLYSSAIHTVAAVAKSPGCNLTQLLRSFRFPRRPPRSSSPS
jgi:hypothetical protein